MRVEDGGPVRAARLDIELGDQQADDVRQSDWAGRQMHLAEGDRFLAATEVEGSEATREVEVRERDRADSGRVPVIGEDLAAFAVEQIKTVAAESIL